MKYIKYLVAFSIINAIFMAGLVAYTGRSNSKMIDNPLPVPTSVAQPSVDTGSTYQPQPSTTSNPSPQTKNTQVSVASPTPTPVADNRCIITIDGAKYDVTQFRLIHSGGDIFQCGTDMSTEFWSQHGQRQLNQIQRYKI